MPEGVTDPNYVPQPGRLGNLTIPQAHALEKFRKELQDEDHFVPGRMDDASLLRFLRARKFDVPAAKAMLLNAEQWRKDFKVEELVKTFNFEEREAVAKYYPQYYHKTDIDGRPIYVEQLGQLDTAALFTVTTPERLVQRLVVEYERSFATRLPAASASVGHPVETYCTILDLGGIGVSSFYQVKALVNEASKVGQDRYPETMGKFYIINAPWAFTVVWNLIKGWLDAVTVAKIKILGSNYKDALLQQIPAANLPKAFGGLCECPGGCTLSDAGPWNPEK